ncbi:Amiloride-sensitive sodium channel [Necator americanus]|uniref:Amiloride-sensitive sodium channel n=1 Tax=Necator americanus TaxID=51031 RepID=W2SXX6_NECAM|nr:Amiloride-sensitive sodium channel [Necator americanus]ETN73736.1 Amiloride-sensitive sodium channel [Necator americanus]
MEFLIDANTLYGTADRANLHVGEKALESYLMTHPNFTVQEFFMDAGFECEESMMLCSFGGRQFSCCQYMTAILTNLGKCYTLDLQSSGKDWMEKQMEAGVTAGPYNISLLQYILLSAERWGNCTSKWPHDFDSQLPYSAVNCDSICKAKFFNAKCGCSPFTYDIEKSFSLCTPFQTVRCIDDYIRKTVNGVAYYDIPRCSECQVECDSVVYHAYNSYGHGFSNGALKWLSDIGGNMGLFLGMSVITVIEVVMYFSKIGWITISKKRRNYMYQKKANEKEHEKQLEETVNGFRLFRSRKYANDMSHTRARIRALTDKVSSENDAESKSTSERESDATDRRSRFFNENTESYYSDNPERNRNSVVELKINLRDLEHVNNGYMQVQANYRTRPRSSTAPTYPCFTVGEEE